MTIPNGTEQRECDLIAPSGAPLTEQQIRELMLYATKGMSREDKADIIRCAKNLAAVAYAAGQAHPQGQGGPLWEAVYKLYYAGIWSCDRPCDELALWTAVRDAAGFFLGVSPKPAQPSEPQAQRQGPPREPTPAMSAAGFAVPEAEHDPAGVWQSMYDAAPAASQAAPAAVAESMLWRNPAPDAAPSSMPSPMQEMTIGMRPDGRRLLNDAPAKAQEPDARSDALVLNLRINAKYSRTTVREYLRAAADRIKADAAELKRQNEANDMLAEERDAFQARAATLQAQHEADAARIADLEWSAKMSAQTSEGAYNGVAILLHDAQAARDEALSSLAEAERLLRDVPDDDPGSIVWTRIRVFLARPLILAQADERSDKVAG